MSVVADAVVGAVVAVVGLLAYFGLTGLYDSMQAPLRVRRFRKGRTISIPLGFYDAIGTPRDKRCDLVPSSGDTFSIRCRQGGPVVAGRWVSTLDPREEFINYLKDAFDECHTEIDGYHVIHVHAWERRHVAPIVSIRDSDYELLVTAFRTAQPGNENRV
ncbi:hypothetical protein GA707_19795 [Nostocoides sp. F2B08]|uniref:hypothetical protein n=1 Tax=Nostocoides sp. F2B08 TaxID=2653936 RepID=UPI001263A5FB|nr:hypothetical protein [Tetrasphaera sp. F2B08]KAB7740012.1 hypothetical protein GA707_19795 [Tetrasphaera sp. F2B08]